MVSFNYALREMTVKIVYYGPGLCGKTTNLQRIYKQLSPKDRTEMVSVNTETERTLFFDLLGINLGTVRGFKTKVQLTTVPGQIMYNDMRKLVLRGADAIVFVADSQVQLQESNEESLANLVLNLKGTGIDIEDMPLVFQWNKRDITSAVPVEEMERRLNPKHLPSFPAIAMKGPGVFETMKAVVTLGLEDVQRKHLDENKKIEADELPDAEVGPDPGKAQQGLRSSTSEESLSGNGRVEPNTPSIDEDAPQALGHGDFDDSIARRIVEGEIHDPEPVEGQALDGEQIVPVMPQDDVSAGKSNQVVLNEEHPVTPDKAITRELPPIALSPVPSGPVGLKKVPSVALSIAKPQKPLIVSSRLPPKAPQMIPGNLAPKGATPKMPSLPVPMQRPLIPSLRNIDKAIQSGKPIHLEIPQDRSRNSLSIEVCITGNGANDILCRWTENLTIQSGEELTIPVKIKHV